MGTRRLGWTSPAPTTEFYYEADVVAASASGNYSVVRTYLGSTNRGNTGSFSNYDGKHAGAVVGEGQVTWSGKLVSGVPNGADRWRVLKDIHVPHGADGRRGDVTLSMTISGWFNHAVSTALGGFTRIPKKASKPGTPKVTDILPTSVRLTWTASTDNGGSPITGYLVRRWDNAAGTGKYVDNFANNLTRVITGLTPGRTYRFVVFARNGSHDVHSEASAAVTAQPLAGAWVGWKNTWKRAIIYVHHGGRWKVAAPFVKVGNTWRRAG